MPGQYLIAATCRPIWSWTKARDTTRRPRARAYHGHGYFPDHPTCMRRLCCLAQASRGRHIGQVKNVDVAPTMARLLGVELPKVTGRVLIRRERPPRELRDGRVF